MNEPMILASGSPRRRELLALAGIPFRVQVSQTDETLPQGISPEKAVEILAQRKARSIPSQTELILAADTVVALDGKIYGKPQNEEDARRILAELSGKIHQVHTGVCLRRGEKERVFHETAQVEFYPLTEEEIARYVASGEPMDKAGAYGIQGYGALFISGIQGDYYNVMGLPVCRLGQLLETLGVHCMHLAAQRR